MSLFDSASLVVTPNGYKATKLYSVIPSDGTGDMTFARAGNTATRVNASGLIEAVNADIPRLDYFGGGCPKLLLEPQRTNELTYSDAFDNAAWTKSGATISSNAVASPDGTTNADKLVESSNNENHFIYKAIGGSSKTFSFFAKAAERNWVGVLCDNGITYFNISTGVVGTIASGVTAKIENYGNGWFRCSITSPHGTYAASVYLSTGNGVDTYLGNGTSGVYIWGMQLEAGSYATSYIPTTSAAVTRNADSSIKTSIGSILASSEYTLFFNGIHNRTSLYNSFCTIYNNSNLDNSIRFYRLNTNNEIRASINNTATSFNLDFGSGITSETAKVALRAKGGNYALYVNGIGVFNTNAGVPPTNIDSISLDYFNNSQAFGLKMNSVAIWKTGLSNADLAALTSL